MFFKEVGSVFYIGARTRLLASLPAVRRDHKIPEARCMQLGQGRFTTIPVSVALALHTHKVYATLGKVE